MAKKSLVSQEPSTAVAVPPSTGVTVAPSSGQTPYVIFANRKSQKWDDWKGLWADLKEGEPLLIRPEPLSPLRLDPFRFALVQGESLWVVTGDAPPYPVLQASLTEQRGDGWAEAYEAVILIFLGNGVMPARVSARRAQCSAFTMPAKLLAPGEDSPPMVCTDEWLGRSPAHKATGKIETLAARIVNKVNLTSGTGKTGRPWHGAKSKQEPATAEEAAMVTAAMDSPAMKAVAEAYFKRIGELRSLVK